MFDKISLIKLARKADIKNIPDDSFDLINNIIRYKLQTIIDVALVVNSESQTKILTANDVHNAIKILGDNMAYTKTFEKKCSF